MADDDCALGPGGLQLGDRRVIPSEELHPGPLPGIRTLASWCQAASTSI